MTRAVEAEREWLGATESDVVHKDVVLGRPSVEEHFNLLAYDFNPYKAFEIIRDVPRNPVDVDTEEWATGLLACYVDKDGNGTWERPSTRGYRMRMGIGVKWEDLDDPRINIELAGIIGTIPAWVADTKQAQSLIVDGHHRLAKRWKLGKEYTSFYVLDEEETISISEYLQHRQREEGM